MDSNFVGGERTRSSLSRTKDVPDSDSYLANQVRHVSAESNVQWKLERDSQVGKAATGAPLNQQQRRQLQFQRNERSFLENPTISARNALLSSSFGKEQRKMEILEQMNTMSTVEHVVTEASNANDLRRSSGFVTSHMDLLAFADVSSTSATQSVTLNNDSINGSDSDSSTRSGTKRSRQSSSLSQGSEKSDSFGEFVIFSDGKTLQEVGFMPMNVTPSAGQIQQRPRRAFGTSVRNVPPMSGRANAMYLNRQTNFLSLVEDDGDDSTTSNDRDADSQSNSNESVTSLTYPQNDDDSTDDEDERYQYSVMLVYDDSSHSRVETNNSLAAQSSELPAQDGESGSKQDQPVQQQVDQLNETNGQVGRHCRFDLNEQLQQQQQQHSNNEQVRLEDRGRQVGEMKRGNVLTKGRSLRRMSFIGTFMGGMKNAKSRRSVFSYANYFNDDESQSDAFSIDPRKKHTVSWDNNSSALNVSNHTNNGQPLKSALKTKGGAKATRQARFVVDEEGINDFRTRNSGLSSLSCALPKWKKSRSKRSKPELDRVGDKKRHRSKKPISKCLSLSIDACCNNKYCNDHVKWWTGVFLFLSIIIAVLLVVLYVAPGTLKNASKHQSSVHTLWGSDISSSSSSSSRSNNSDVATTAPNNVIILSSTPSYVSESPQSTQPTVTPLPMVSQTQSPQSVPPTPSQLQSNSPTVQSFKPLYINAGSSNDAIVSINNKEYENITWESDESYLTEPSVKNTSTFIGCKALNESGIINSGSPSSYSNNSNATNVTTILNDEYQGWDYNLFCSERRLLAPNANKTSPGIGIGKNLTYEIPVVLPIQLLVSNESRRNNTNLYKVRLYFNEMYYESISQRIFDIYMEGRVVMPNFDVFKETSQQKFTIVVVETIQHVVDGSITIDLIPIKGYASINAIEVSIVGRPVNGTETIITRISAPAHLLQLHNNHSITENPFYPTQAPLSTLSSRRPSVAPTLKSSAQGNGTGYLAPVALRKTIIPSTTTTTQPSTQPSTQPNSTISSTYVPSSMMIPAPTKAPYANKSQTPSKVPTSYLTAIPSASPSTRHSLHPSYGPTVAGSEKAEGGELNVSKTSLYVNAGFVRVPVSSVNGTQYWDYDVDYVSSQDKGELYNACPMKVENLTFPDPSEAIACSERYFKTLGQYEIPAFSSNTQKYRYVLHFVELYFNKPGLRVFNVSIEDKQIASNVDVVELTGGKLKLYSLTGNVTILDGGISIKLESVLNYAKINAFELHPI